MKTSKKNLKSGPVLESVLPYIKRGEIAGAVVLVACRNRIIEFAAAGHADIKSRRPAKKDDIYWIASMTKPMVATAIMMLVDKGELSVDDPVEKHLPEFKDKWVIEEKTDDRMVVRRFTGPLTLRHLLAHTDGLADVPVPCEHTPLAEWVAATARQPLLFAPGSRWNYNNSGLNALGRIVEVVSGQSLPKFFEKRFFEPLGMKDTAFILKPKQLKRLVTSYQFSDEKKKLVSIPIFLLKGDLTSSRLTICPGGGLFSTARDVFAFYQMLLDGGVRDGRRYLSPKAFREMTKIQTGDLKTGFTEGMSFGLGVGIVRDPSGETAMLSKGTFGHGGAFGTGSWVDPVRNATMILMIQRSNLQPNPDGSGLRKDYNEAVVKLLSAS